ncbi:hypothetical protein VRRI112168_02360 [Vreelandella rituensis]|uniref:Uncharacterized protein n=1 Tax=Vreelandella rituensis TaxID=2282306 RepID=A0A368U921_9GAMM|nr:hypothetical protein [Halomonas rituensis]RCV93590.1 hypothetical protein DU506_00100 [Halomonas rituensis]
MTHQNSAVAKGQGRADQDSQGVPRELSAAEVAELRQSAEDASKQMDDCLDACEHSLPIKGQR